MRQYKLWLSLGGLVALTMAFGCLTHQRSQTAHEVEKTERIVGINYSPFRDGQSPLTGVFPTIEQIREDLTILSEITSYIRIYSVTNILALIPTLAKDVGLKVVPTAWLGRNENANKTEISNLIAIANREGNIPFVAVGSETLVRGDLTKNRLKEYLAYVKKRVHIPVTTAEPWHIWRDNPDLSDSVDLIFVNIYPYWDKVPIDKAVEYVIQRCNELKLAHPEKRIVISETGWATSGAKNGGAVPSLENQKRFIQELLYVARKKNLEFFIFEAFDEKWKRDVEGEVGANWGIFYSNRKPKHEPTTLKFAK